MFSKRRDSQPPPSSGRPPAQKGKPPAPAPQAAQPAPAADPARSENDEMRDMWSAMAALLDNTTVRADGSSAEASTPLTPPAQPQAISSDVYAAAPYDQAGPPAPPAPPPTAPSAPPAAPAFSAASATLPPAQPYAQGLPANNDPSRWAPPSLLPPGSAPAQQAAPPPPAQPDAQVPAMPVAPVAPEAPYGQPGTAGIGPQLQPAPDDALFGSAPAPRPAAQQPAPPPPHSHAQTPFVPRVPGSPFTMPALLDQNAVTLRGRSDGVAIEIGSGKWEDLMQLLSYRLEQTDSFFSGGFVTVDVGTRQINEAELDLLNRVMASYAMHTGLLRTSAERTFQAALALGVPGAQVALDGTVVSEAMPALATDNSFPFFVYRGTLRSGQQLFRPEHIMVLGDVNPGAEVASNGDILIWGRLRGIAHAGAQGNTRAIIAALDLDPVQLRIDTVAAAPAGQTANAGPRWGAAHAAERRPEIARLVNGRLLIEAWDDVKTAGSPVLKQRRA